MQVICCNFLTETCGKPALDCFRNFPTFNLAFIQPILKKYIVEFLGSFFLILTIVCVVGGSDANNFTIPLAIGSSLMMMVYAGGHISGGHYNPAVTLGVFIRGKLAGRDVPIYMLAQILGGIAAAVLGATVLERGTLLGGGTDLPTNIPAAFCAEFLGTFALVWVVLQTATAKGTAGNSFYGLAIGFCYLSMLYALGDYGTGGCFNPAVAIAAALNGLTSWGTAGIAIGASLLGGIFSTLVFKFCNK